MNLDWENIEPTPLAGELHDRFCAKMAPGGEIDRILNGAQPIEKLQPETDAQIDLRKRQIHIQLEEYADAIAAYAAWVTAWFARRPKGFRAARRKPAGEAGA